MRKFLQMWLLLILAATAQPASAPLLPTKDQTTAAATPPAATTAAPKSPLLASEAPPVAVAPLPAATAQTSSAPLHAPRPVNFGRYANPLPIALPDGTNIESCPDPSVIQSQTPGDDGWYMYCTNDLFHDNGPLHRMAISRSTDLAHWTYIGDVFSAQPSFLPRNAGLWAPDIQFFNGKYYLYFSASATVSGGPAIFAATSDSPAGPFTASPTPVIPPERLSNGTWRDVIDSDMVTEDGQRYLIYGSFNGGVMARLLSDDGFSTIPSSEQQISPSRRYEGSYVVQHEGYFYLFVSAGNCCDGGESGYGVFVARAPHALGPYVDRDGVSLMAPRVGGTPVLQMNGNRWLGPGHNSIFTDAAGQDWMLYHAIDTAKPTLAGGWTRRPAMIDPIDWTSGWPSVRASAGASDQSEPAPAIEATSPAMVETPTQPEIMGPIFPQYSDEFEGTKFNARWSWMYATPKGTFALSKGSLLFATQSGNLLAAQHNAPLLVEYPPSGDWIAEAKLNLNAPDSGQYNSVQAGIVIIQDASHFLKLTLQCIDGTRQLEFARMDGPGILGRAYLASAAPEVWLRIARHGAIYTSYSSRDGVQWTRGPSWTLDAPSARIGLISAGGSGFTASFDYFHLGARQ